MNVKSILRQAGIALALGAVSVAASAHTGHGTHGFFAGLEHPMGLDHLLAMVAVGVWSAAALPAGRKAWGPMAFIAALIGGAVLGTQGVALPLVESAIAMSVVLFGLMLVLARRLPVAAGLTVVAASAALHGLAHGAELPNGASFAAYAAGFVLTTAALHTSGLSLGLWLQRRQAWLWSALGLAVSASGLVLLARI